MSVGIKETKEALVAACEVGVLLVSVLKDGLQPAADFQAVYAKVTHDPAFIAKVTAAVSGAQLIPAELEDLSWLEKFELMKDVASYTDDFLAALKSKA